MALFKDTVALEACPAKTAESVSYVATFAVLGWLVISNYSGLGYAGMESTSLADMEADATLADQSGLPPALAAAEPPSNLPPSTLAQSPQGAMTENESQYTPLSDLAAWHDSLQPSQRPASQLGSREFTASAWNSESAIETQLTESYHIDLSPTLPLVGGELLSQSSEGLELLLPVSDDSGPIHEITITGSEPNRLVARPDNIRRPQLPRPYRAQEIQRLLVLPPRIQALRP